MATNPEHGRNICVIAPIAPMSLFHAPRRSAPQSKRELRSGWSSLWWSPPTGGILSSYNFFFFFYIIYIKNHPLRGTPNTRRWSFALTPLRPRLRARPGASPAGGSTPCHTGRSTPAPPTGGPRNRSIGAIGATAQIFPLCSRGVPPLAPYSRHNSRLQWPTGRRGFASAGLYSQAGESSSRALADARSGLIRSCHNPLSGAWLGDTQ